MRYSFDRIAPPWPVVISRAGLAAQFDFREIARPEFDRAENRHQLLAFGCQVVRLAADGAGPADEPPPLELNKPFGQDLGCDIRQAIEVLDCEVLAVEPNSALTYSWDFTHDDPAFNLKSEVTFTLTPTSTGTLLRMEQSGFQPNQKQAYGGAHAAWKQFLAKLEQVLARTD